MISVLAFLSLSDTMHDNFGRGVNPFILPSVRSCVPIAMIHWSHGAVTSVQ